MSFSSIEDLNQSAGETMGYEIESLRLVKKEKDVRMEFAMESRVPSVQNNFHMRLEIQRLMWHARFSSMEKLIRGITPGSVAADYTDLYWKV